MYSYHDLLASKTPQEIHDLSRDMKGGAFLEADIRDYFSNSDLFTEEEIIEHMMIEAYDKQNIFALKTIAEWYRDGIYVDQSDTQYIETLKKIRSAPKAIDAIWTCKDAYDDVFVFGHTRGGYGSIDHDTWLWSSVAGDAQRTIGTYNASSSDLDTLRDAESDLREALWCHLDTEELLNKVKIKIQNLKYKQEIRTNEKIFDLREGLYETSLKDADNILQGSFRAVSQETQNSFKLDNWEHLTIETKTYLLTALYCYTQLTAIGIDNYEAVDFSSVVSPLMRGLEYEIKLRFFYKYLSFLKRTYPEIADYADAININIKDLPVYRKCIIKKLCRHCYDYRSDDEAEIFMIGSLSRTIGYENNSNEILIDKPAIEFCKTELLKGKTSDDEIKDWLKYLCDNVEDLRGTRNRASHGGNVLNIDDAEETLDRLVRVQKLIEYIVEGCN